MLVEDQAVGNHDDGVEDLLTLAVMQAGQMMQAAADFHVEGEVKQVISGKIDV